MSEFGPAINPKFPINAHVYFETIPGKPALGTSRAEIKKSFYNPYKKVNIYEMVIYASQGKYKDLKNLIYLSTPAIKAIRPESELKLASNPI